MFVQRYFRRHRWIVGCIAVSFAGLVMLLTPPSILVSLSFQFDCNDVICRFDLLPSLSLIVSIYLNTLFAFDRTHTIFVVFQSRGFYDVPWVLIADARSFQALAAILD